MKRSRRRRVLLFCRFLQLVTTITFYGPISMLYYYYDSLLKAFRIIKMLMALRKKLELSPFTKLIPLRLLIRIDDDGSCQCYPHGGALSIALPPSSAKVTRLDRMFAHLLHLIIPPNETPLLRQLIADGHEKNLKNMI